jgi:hypothetical protein
MQKSEYLSADMIPIGYGDIRVRWNDIEISIQFD